MILSKKLTIFLLFFTLFLASCKEEDTVEAPAAAPGVVQPVFPPQCEYSKVTFAGLQGIDEIKQESLTLHWNKVEGAATYSVFQVDGDGKLNFKKVVGSGKDKVEIGGLQAQTTYRFLVRMMDQEGKMDSNKEIVEATTIAYPAYTNTASLLLEGAQSVGLAASIDFFGKSKSNFTFSLWFKTSQFQNDRRLVNFHREATPSSAANLALQSDSISLGYRDENGDYHTLSYQTSYADSSWHHVVGTYNGKKFVLYLDGAKVAEVKDTFIGFGTAKAQIGSYNGSSNQFAGLIDEVSIWKGALNLSKVAEIYNSGSSFDLIQHSQKNKLKAWYRMGGHPDDSTSLIKDHRGSFDGTPVNIDGDNFSADAP